MDVSQIAVNKGIKNKLELLAFANAQKKSGKTDLAKFFANRGFKAVKDALKIGWKLEQAPHDLERLSKTRMETLKGFLNTECATGCDKKWLDTA